MAIEVSQGVVAERGGFEPPLPVTVNTLSKRIWSANKYFDRSNRNIGDYRR